MTDSIIAERISYTAVERDWLDRVGLHLSQGRVSQGRREPGRKSGDLENTPKRRWRLDLSA